MAIYGLQALAARPRQEDKVAAPLQFQATAPVPGPAQYRPQANRRSGEGHVVCANSSEPCRSPGAWSHLTSIKHVCLGRSKERNLSVDRREKCKLWSEPGAAP